MRFFNRLASALLFLTRIPLPWHPPFSQEDFGAALLYSPLVGLIIGGVLSVVAWFFQHINMSSLLSAALILVIYQLISGVLHMDGLGDTFDGLGAGGDKERKLAIMRDSRIGSFGLLAIINVLLCDFAALHALASISSWPYFLLIWPCLGRLAILVSASLSTYARSEGGLGKSLVDYCNWQRSWPVLCLVFLICLVVLPYDLAFMLYFSTCFLAWSLNSYIKKQIGGATGDTLGAVVELCQAGILILSVLYFH